MGKRAVVIVGAAVIVLALVGCEKSTPTYSWSGSIKKSQASCTFRGVYLSSLRSPTKVYTTCTFASTAGGGEHPYVIQGIGCQYRFNGQNGETHSYVTDCNGDGIPALSMQLCQTRGGPFPDDCGNTSSYSFPDQ